MSIDLVKGQRHNFDTTGGCLGDTKMSCYPDPSPGSGIDQIVTKPTNGSSSDIAGKNKSSTASAASAAAFYYHSLFKQYYSRRTGAAGIFIVVQAAVAKLLLRWLVGSRRINSCGCYFAKVGDTRNRKHLQIIFWTVNCLP